MTPDSREPSEHPPSTSEDEPAGPVVVGVGASAGGLEAFRRLLEHIPPDTGLAFALVQHLTPGRESRLPELLQGATNMPVAQAEHGVTLEPDHVYVIPPGALMTVEEGVLRLTRRIDGGGHHMPVDHFFRSLAERAGDRAIGVILSGTATDGTAGLREIRAVGGVAMAQDPETADHSGMPRSAVSAAVVDVVLPPEEMGPELARLARHPYVRPWGAPPDPDWAYPLAEPRKPKTGEPDLRNVYQLLRRATGVDFSNYKEGTFRRRLHRRMMIHAYERMDDYLAHLQERPDEMKSLFEDVLIHVTRFFRDPEVFEALKEVVFPELLQLREEDRPIRIWVAGCASGEEAYSVAIALQETLGERRLEVPVQIFATDVYEEGIEQARSGRYRDSISADVSDDRLKRFFRSTTGGGYLVSKSLREMCVFSRHDLTRDPPFSHIDLLVCRNVLIYLNQSTQDRVLASFHYALKSTGYLVLGEAETPKQDSELFTPVDKKHRIYAPLPASPRIHHHPAGVHEGGGGWELGPAKPEPQTDPVQREADRFIVNHFGPPGVVVDDQNRIHYVCGSTSAFLEAPPGEPTHDLMKMAREGLLHALRSTLREAHDSGRRSRAEGIHVLDHGNLRAATVEVVPLQTGGKRRFFLVLFQDEEEAEAKTPEAEGSEARAQWETATQDEKDERIRALEEELASSRNYLRSVIQDLEATNEELQTANEEILSANEELQSTNEELDTAREELQSSNEELNTLNDELQGRNQQLAEANSDLENLLASAELAVVIVDENLRIRRFTPPAKALMNLIEGDIGRPLGHLSPNVACEDLEALVRGTVDDIRPVTREVPGRQDHEGHWYQLAIKPYQGADNRIEGAILSFYDISALKRRERERERERRRIEALAEAMHEPLLVLDGQLRVHTVNGPFCDTFDVTVEGITGRRLGDLSNRKWDLASLEEGLARLRSNDGGGEVLQLTQPSPGNGPRTFRVNARRVAGDEEEDGEDERFLLAFKADEEETA